MLSDSLADKLDPLKTSASSWLNQVTERTVSIDNYLIESVSNSVNSGINHWLSHHPLLAWLVSHPLITLIIGFVISVLIIRLLVTIYQAIAHMIDRLWLWILRSPWLLMKFLFGWSAKPVTTESTITNYEVTQNPEQLQEIMLRLDKIQQQQERIIRDLAQLKQRPKTIEPQQLRLLEKK